MIVAATPPPPPVPILLHASEFTFSGSRRSGFAGRWRVNLANIGQDEHDVWVLNRQTKLVLGHSRRFLPGEHGAITVRLRPGTYTLYCGVANHRALGMRWHLMVVKRPIRRTTR